MPRLTHAHVKSTSQSSSTRLKSGAVSRTHWTTPKTCEPRMTGQQTMLHVRSLFSLEMRPLKRASLYTLSVGQSCVSRARLTFHQSSLSVCVPIRVALALRHTHPATVLSETPIQCSRPAASSVNSTLFSRSCV